MGLSEYERILIKIIFKIWKFQRQETAKEFPQKICKNYSRYFFNINGQYTTDQSIRRLMNKKIRNFLCL